MHAYPLTVAPTLFASSLEYYNTISLLASTHNITIPISKVNALQLSAEFEAAKQKEIKKYIEANAYEWVPIDSLSGEQLRSILPSHGIFAQKGPSVYK